MANHVALRATAVGQLDVERADIQDLAPVGRLLGQDLLVQAGVAGVVVPQREHGLRALPGSRLVDDLSPEFLVIHGRPSIPLADGGA